MRRQVQRSRASILEILIAILSELAAPYLFGKAAGDFVAQQPPSEVEGPGLLGHPRCMGLGQGGGSSQGDHGPGSARRQTGFKWKTGRKQGGNRTDARVRKVDLTRDPLTPVTHAPLSQARSLCAAAHAEQVCGVLIHVSNPINMCLSGARPGARCCPLLQQLEWP